MSRYNYRRRSTCTVRVGDVAIGGDNPVRLQSMTNTSTNDTEASARQAAAIVAAGGEIVRLTTQGEREAANMALIADSLRDMGVRVPLVADVHFNPKAAYVAAGTCDKVRINPGNFVDAARTFRQLEYTDTEYAAEQTRIADALLPLLDICRRHGTALRMGVNHGSLSDRIMSRYGDTPEGMTESVMEFLRICRRENFNDIVISIKASNTVVMVRTMRMLVRAMEKEGMDYPLHLGVTEAGDGEDGRIKSAVGIGTLLAEGLGDTIRVSLSEAPENEIPVAAMLRDYICSRAGHEPVTEPDTEVPYPARDMATPHNSTSERLIAMHHDPNFVSEQWHRVDASQQPSLYGDTLPVILTSTHRNPVGEMQSWMERFLATGGTNPIVLALTYEGTREEVMIKSAADMGTMLLNGYGNGIMISSPALSAKELGGLELSILQATRLRITKTEYIACPGCGRTLFDLSDTLNRVRKATSHLKGLKIGVMGCIVNGPGEMADADYGYVGAAAGRVSLYKGKTLMVRNIPAEEAPERLVELIRAEGDWIEPDVQ